MRRWFPALCLSLAACGGRAANTGGEAPGKSVQEPGPEKKKTETLDVKFHSAQTSFDDAETAFTAAGNDCIQFCKALASMNNATERLCELAKENGDEQRCTDAKTKLDAARVKVKSTCGGCG